MYFWLICIIYTGWWKTFIENNFKILVKLKKKFGLDFLKITTYLEVQDRLIWLWNMNQLYVVKQKHWPDEHLCEQFFVLPNTSMLWLELWQLRVNLLYKRFPWKYFFKLFCFRFRLVGIFYVKIFLPVLFQIYIQRSEGKIFHNQCHRRTIGS